MIHVARDLAGLLDDLAETRTLSDMASMRIEQTARRLLSTYGRCVIQKLDGELIAALTAADHRGTAMWSLVRSAVTLLCAACDGGAAPEAM
ncbi:hypothetical protein [Flavisphingomonas formosensis]|uniref:hypothetical protein n=1 Tax=Flavisphingomonas formosensis TaxID=861534 RepID=UPI0012FC687C|nr:hypothetical protein [Sphingomonas formosensis]